MFFFGGGGFRLSSQSRRNMDGPAMNSWRFTKKLFIQWIKDQKVLTETVSREVDRELRSKGFNGDFTDALFNYDVQVEKFGVTKTKAKKIKDLWNGIDVEINCKYPERAEFRRLLVWAAKHAVKHCWHGGCPMDRTCAKHEQRTFAHVLGQNGNRGMVGKRRGGQNKFETNNQVENCDVHYKIVQICCNNTECNPGGLTGSTYCLADRVE